MDMTVEVPELPELTFDEASHIYRLNGDIMKPRRNLSA